MAVDQILKNILQFRHPIAAILGLGVGIVWGTPLALSSSSTFSDADNVLVGLVAAAAGAIGAAIFAYTAHFLEWGWRSSRRCRTSFWNAALRRQKRNRLRRLPEDVRAFVAKSLAAQTYLCPSFEHTHDEAYLAHKLVHLGLAKSCPNPLVHQFTDEAWDIICASPAVVGLELRIQRDFHGREARRFVGHSA